MNRSFCLAACLALTLAGTGAAPAQAAPDTLERALYADPAPSAFGPGKRLPPQAIVLVPLMLQSIPLASISPALLERAVRDAADVGREDDDAEAIAESDGAARVRLLLAAGFSPVPLSEDAAVAALSAPDRALASELLARGMLHSGSRTGNAHVLLAAVAWRRADLLPQLLQLGYDPNLRSGGDPSPVDYAIQLGAVDELAVLLDGGGRMEADVRDAHGGVLDRAVASNNEAMLRLVTGKLGRHLEQVCVPDTKMLVHTVMHASPVYWRLLRHEGFATDAKACPGQAERVTAALAADASQHTAGPVEDNLRKRVPRLGVRDDS